MTEHVTMTAEEYETYPSRLGHPEKEVWYRFEGDGGLYLIKYHDVPVDMRMCTLKIVEIVDAPISS